MRRRKSKSVMYALTAVAALTALWTAVAIRTDVAQAQALMRDATIIADGHSKHIRTAETTVGAALKDAGIKVGPEDIVYPKQNVRLYGGIRIRVVRVVEQVVTEEQPIAFQVKRQPTNQLRVGMAKTVSEGKRGLKKLEYRIRTEDGVVKNRTLISAEVVKQPEDKVILIGDRGAGVSRGSFVSRKALTMNATAYDPGPKSCGPYANGRTSAGMKAGFGVVAVDPRVISLGTRLYVESYGYAIAGDTGRAIKGNRIDLGFNTYAEAIAFGRKKLKVYILE